MLRVSEICCKVICNIIGMHLSGVNGATTKGALVCQVISLDFQ